MDTQKPQTEAILWMDQGVLFDTLTGRKPKLLDQVEQSLAFMQDKGLAMAIVTERIPEAVLSDLMDTGLLKYFQENGKTTHAIIFPAAFYRQHSAGEEGANATTMNTPLTQAFLSARTALGTDPKHTIAIANSLQTVKQARYAGLPVIGMAAGAQVEPLSVASTRENMGHHGAFYTASSAIDLPAAVMHFRPPSEAKWQPIAAPGSGSVR